MNNGGNVHVLLIMVCTNAKVEKIKQGLPGLERKSIQI